MNRSNWKTARARQHSLYPGQREALTRRAEGEDNQQIADAMQVSKDTVTSYLGAAREALGADSIDAAVLGAGALGLIPFYREG